MDRQPTFVIGLDGQRYDTWSEDWRAVCEAVHVLGRPQEGWVGWMAGVERKRGAAGRLKLESDMNRLEPYYLLAMGTKEQRRAYLEQTEQHRGKLMREWIEQRIVAIWNERKKAAEAAA